MPDRLCWFAGLSAEAQRGQGPGRLCADGPIRPGGERVGAATGAVDGRELAGVVVRLEQAHAEQLQLRRPGGTHGVQVGAEVAGDAWGDPRGDLFDAPAPCEDLQHQPEGDTGPARAGRRRGATRRPPRVPNRPG